MEYIKSFLYYFIIALITGIITVFITYPVQAINNNILEVLINAIICVIVPNTIFILLFHKTEEYKYFKEMMLNLLKKISKKSK